MITQPTIGPLLRLLSRDLRTIVEPGLSDRGVIVTVQMMAAMLDALAVRCSNETMWMREETESVLALAARILRKHPQSETLRGALDAAMAVAGDADLQRYERAGEVLSCAAEVALRAGDIASDAEVRRVLQLRLDHEVAMIGEDFQPVGRS